MTTIVGISGSLRQGSFNTSLLRAAAALAPEGVTIEIASIRDIPLYDGDLEAQSGVPAPVTRLQDRIAAAQGLLIATPEYNGSIPGVLKNAIDWLSRPPREIARVFGDRAVAVMGATPGRAGTILSQAAWLPVLRHLNARPFFGARLMVSNAGSVFDGEGALVDESTKKQLVSFLEGFVAFSRAR